MNNRKKQPATIKRDYVEAIRNGGVVEIRDMKDLVGGDTVSTVNGRSVYLGDNKRDGVREFAMRLAGNAVSYWMRQAELRPEMNEIAAVTISFSDDRHNMPVYSQLALDLLLKERGL